MTVKTVEQFSGPRYPNLPQNNLALRFAGSLAKAQENHSWNQGARRAVVCPCSQICFFAAWASRFHAPDPQTRARRPASRWCPGRCKLRQWLAHRRCDSTQPSRPRPLRACRPENALLPAAPPKNDNNKKKNSNNNNNTKTNTNSNSNSNYL